MRGFVCAKGVEIFADMTSPIASSSWHEVVVSGDWSKGMNVWAFRLSCPNVGRCGAGADGTKTQDMCRTCSSVTLPYLVGETPVSVARTSPPTHYTSHNQKRRKKHFHTARSAESISAGGESKCHLDDEK